MMKKKRAPYISAYKKNEDTSKAKVTTQVHTTTNNSTKGVSEYADLTKEQTANNFLTNASICRSTSLNKQENKIPVSSNTAKQDVNTRTFGCTYFGQGFIKAQHKDNKPSPSPYTQQKSAYRKTRLNSMHKTATYWTSSNKAQKSKFDHDNDHINKKQLASNIDVNSFKSNYAGEGYLPVIDEKTQKQQFHTDNVEPDTNDTYIKYVSCNKRSRAGALCINRSKETEQGYIVPIDRRIDHTKSVVSNEAQKLSVRAFNWEGIHFEVSPKRDGSCDSSNMHMDYANDMNLMAYDFNGSINRNGSESPKPDNIVRRDTADRKHLTIQSKTTSNFASKKAKGVEPVQQQQTEQVHVEQKVEETESSLAKKLYQQQQQYNSPRQFADTRIRLENEARRYKNIAEAQNGPRRKKSPPPLTPITNNSNNGMLLI